jgi:hypothetical protein
MDVPEAPESAHARAGRGVASGGERWRAADAVAAGAATNAVPCRVESRLTLILSTGEPQPANAVDSEATAQRACGWPQRASALNTRQRERSYGSMPWRRKSR